jgi:outer membrane protein assembly factor BamB
MTRRRVWLTVVLACVPLVWPKADAAPPAFEWPQWRGPNRDGLVTGLTPRASWPEAPTPGWRIAVGTGHASPIVSGDRVYQFSREGESEVVRALDLASGRERWKQSYPVAYEMNSAATGHGKGPKATPTLADGRLFTFGITGILSAWNAADGRLDWRKSFETSHRTTSPVFGAAMSPVVDRGRVIAHVGGENDGALVALDAATGGLLWSWKGDGPGYASPVVATFDGVRQVVTQSQNALVGVATETGALLWKVALKTPYEQNSITPIVGGGLVVYSGLDVPLTAARPVKKGAAFLLETAWTNPDGASYLSTPVLDGGRLYGLSHRKKGQWFCIDAASGRTLWLSDGRQAENAAILAGAGALFLLDTDGAMTVAAAEPSAFRPLRKWSVAKSATWAHPVVLDAGILVKDVDSLAFVRTR